MAVACNLIFDSCCDLPRTIWDVPGVTMLPFTYTDGEKSYTDDSYESRTPHDFYEWLRAGATPSTSQPSQLEFETAFRKAVTSGIPTVYFSFTRGASGAYEGALAALDRMHAEFGDDIELYVVDTKLGSAPQGLLMVEALRLRERGMTAPEIVNWAQEALYFVQTIFMVEDLTTLHRGGRIPASVAIAGSKLDLKPLLSWDLDGKLAVVGAARGRKKGIKRMVELYQKAHDDGQGGQMVAVGQADAPKDADRLVELLEKENPAAVFLRLNIGPTVGSHVGPGMLALSFWGPDRRESISISDRIANKVRNS
ncbi:uncharacterized conserved protein [Cryptobacterium curtum DSM 15641]|uniref:Uncharacterized conserved protein n=1 Tax=Cryptobacterium curtum (strain ATCC 700683 / DSM 15641 / CCUG 43107 / 12-3) TaxID=469378 RepID=C7MNX3_CRYCD|nr:DegV family protein [Cryptobacterium curtum]ACU94613.1 uncharacterized conserved protein [Cryptobacterium curtum DSM 15641]